jgi:hypothetical protein
MSICPACNQDMLTADGCIKVPVEFHKDDTKNIASPNTYPLEDWQYDVANGDTRLGYVEWVEHKTESAGGIILPPRGQISFFLDPIPYGQEKRFDTAETRFSPRENVRCHDCNVLPGQYHHDGCDWAECPNCRHQLLMCGGECA